VQRYRVVIMLVLFGVLPVVAAFFVALSFLGEQEVEPTQAEVKPVTEEAPPPPEPPQTRQVFAAARAMPAGTLIGEDDLITLELDPDAVRKEHIIVPDEVVLEEIVPGEQASHPLRGHVVREALAEGAPLTRSAVVGPGHRGFLAAVLRPGARAVTIRVGPATSHAGLIELGNRVDVILSAELAVDGGDRSVFARTIVEDVRVVAIDRQVGVGLDSPGGGEDGVIERTEMMTATLEASPAQGDRLVLGEHEGSLSLAVRSLAAVTVAQNASEAEAVDLREMLLSSPEFTASEERLRRAQELNDLSIRTQIVESKKQLRAAVESGATKLDAVRIFRGSEPPEEVVFERQ
jgi:pilus assembly protein CpaB